MFAGSIAVGGIGVLTLVVGGLGVAVAANGGSLTLGHSNTATSTTTLQDPQGTPLSLVGKKSKPPLKVNSSKEVKHLNAAEVGGLSASQLKVNGSSAQIKINLENPSNAKVVALPQPTESGSTETLHPVSIVGTSVLKPGTYEVTATVTGEEAICWIGTKPVAGAQQLGIAAEGSSAMTSAVKLTKKTRIREYCAGGDTESSPSDPGGEVYTAGITAVAVAHSTAGIAAVGTIAPDAKTNVLKK
jgi:hypothetical protein